MFVVFTLKLRGEQDNNAQMLHFPDLYGPVAALLRTQQV